jgi:hypothetical protein
MTSAVVLPLWALLLLVAATPLAGWLGARQGAARAIQLCSSHWSCPMKQVEDRARTTQDLEEQLKALRAAHPELVDLRRAQSDAINDTGECPAIPEEKGKEG